MRMNSSINVEVLFHSKFAQIVLNSEILPTDLVRKNKTYSNSNVSLPNRIKTKTMPSMLRILKISFTSQIETRLNANVF